MIPVRREYLVYNRNTRRYERMRDDAYRNTVGVPYSEDRYVGGKRYATQRGYIDAAEREYERRLDDLRSVEEAGDFEDGTIVVDWEKSSMGDQAQATFDYRYRDSNGNRCYRRVEGPRTTGCGYDKQSTAVATALDRSPEFRKAVYDQMEDGRQFSVIQRNGAGIPPRFERGIGMSTYRCDLPKAGIELDQTIDHPKVDVYSIRRAKLKNMAKKAKSNSRVGWDKLTGRRPYRCRR